MPPKSEQLPESLWEIWPHQSIGNEIRVDKRFFLFIWERDPKFVKKGKFKKDPSTQNAISQQIDIYNKNEWHQSIADFAFSQLVYSDSYINVTKSLAICFKRLRHFWVFTFFPSFIASLIIKGKNDPNHFILYRLVWADSSYNRGWFGKARAFDGAKTYILNGTSELIQF